MQKIRLAAAMCYTLLLVTTQLSAQNIWTQLQDLSGPGRTNGFSCALDTSGDGIDDIGFFGSGWDPVNSTTIVDDEFYAFNPNTQTWTRKADYPGLGTRSQAVFVLDGIIYVGSGAYGGTSLSNQLWAYDYATNSWTRKNDLPGGARWGAIGFVLDGAAYYGLGNTSGSSGSPQPKKDLYTYNQVTDTWTRINDFPGAGRTDPFIFELDTDLNNEVDEIMIGCGRGAVGQPYNDSWIYDQATDTWAQRADVPGIDRSDPGDFTIGNRGFVGLGFNFSQASKEWYEYDYANNAWLRMSDYPQAGIWAPYCFALNGKGYIIGGHTNQGSVDFVYQYEPLINGFSEINGQVFADGNSNCLLEGNEFTFANVVVVAQPGPYYTTTDTNGNYTFRVPVGNYNISTQIPTHYSQLVSNITCPASGTHGIAVNSTGTTYNANDFALSTLYCPILNVSITSGGRLRCFTNLNVIEYCNYGLADEDSVYIDLVLPDYISIVSASQLYDTLGNDTYRFWIDTVKVGECGTISFWDLVSCDDINLLGAAACYEAYIYPHNTCLPQNPVWNGANVDISATCIEGTDTAAITISNTGTGDMLDSAALRLFFDGALGYTENFKLAQGDSYTLYVPSAGITIMAEAGQANGHPHNHLVVAWVERCRVDTTVAPLFTIIPNMPLGDEYEQYDVECLPVSGPYDPNDKQAFPSGVTADNIIPPGTTINYKIRFQNTGTDTARNVFIVDTLSNLLDLSTLRVNAASHEFRWELTGLGEPILTFYFDNIMLPDSNVNEPASNGFISFSIAPKATTPLGSVIENFGDIYFDFNPAIRTNTAMLTVDNLPVNLVGTRDGNTIVLATPELAGKIEQLKMFPNPTSGVLNIVATFPANGVAEVTVTDLLGRTVVSERYYGVAGSEEVIQLDVSVLQSGVYHVLVNRNGELSLGRLVKE